MASANREGSSLERYPEQGDRDHLSKGDVDWHPDSWDFMQLWDGLQHPFNKLADPGHAYKQAREETREYQKEDRIYLIRDEEIVNVFEESAEGLTEVDNHDLEYSEIPENQIQNLYQRDVANLTDTSQRTVSRLENTQSKLQNDEEYESEIAQCLNIANYFELGEVVEANNHTKAETVKKLQNLAEGNGRQLTLTKLRDESWHSLANAVLDEELFGNFNDAKNAAGLKTRQSGGARKYPKPDELNYFSEVKDSDSAYWLGMLYADGSLESEEGHKGVELKMTRSSANILKEFKESLGINNPIDPKETDDEQIIEGRKVECDDAVRVRFSAEEIYDDLVDWGCTPKKSHTSKWPNKVEYRPHDIPDQYIPDFVRGLFDGDGNINSQYNDNKANSLQWSVTGNPPVLTELGNVMEEKLDIELTNGKREEITSIERGGDRTIRHTGNKQVTKIFEWMYQNVESGEDPFMSSKLETFVNHVPGYENPHMHGEQLREVQNQLDPLLEEKQAESMPPEEILDNDEVEKI